MSLIIIPLAGPDFYTEKFGIRPLYPVGNSTLIEYVLAKRPWMLNAQQRDTQIIFVLREEGSHTHEMQSFLAKKFPFFETVVLSNLSAGAPLSALAAIALSKHPDKPVIVDLADIAFDMSQNPISYFRDNQNVDAIVPYFNSQNPKFSYLQLENVRVIQAREKKVISSNASAGVYFFRNVAAYLRALLYSIQNPEICKVGEAFFVCPAVNGLITNEREVHAMEVQNVEAMSLFFHG